MCAVGSLSRKTEKKTVRNHSNNNRLPAPHGISSDDTGSLSASIYISGERERHCENSVSYRRAQNGGAVKDQPWLPLVRSSERLTIGHRR